MIWAKGYMQPIATSRQCMRRSESWDCAQAIVGAAAELRQDAL
jgi:hypothetical protein